MFFFLTLVGATKFRAASVQQMCKNHYTISLPDNQVRFYTKKIAVQIQGQIIINPLQFSHAYNTIESYVLIYVQIVETYIPEVMIYSKSRITQIS